MSKYNLTFSTLRTANRLRLPHFKNAKGGQAHSEPDGSDWPLDAWSNAASGELGEACNIIKKLRRGDYALEERPADPKFEGMTVREALAKELADVVCYVDLLALQLGVSLGDAIAEKFNEVSDRVDAPVIINRQAMELIIDGLPLVPELTVYVDGRPVARPVGEP